MNVYFSGIGGVGIGPLAEIALDAGFNICGSDLKESLVTKQLSKRGVNITQDQSGIFLNEQHLINSFDWFVHTSALNDNHPELVKARELGIKTAKRDELLALIVKQRNLKLLAVAGTHGKTTTTGMLIWTFMQLGIPVSYSIGTTISFGQSGRLNPDSKYFIYECDEFDRNFLTFYPEVAVITSIDYDHVDTYPDKQSYLDAFKQFASQCKSVISWRDQYGEIFENFNNTELIESDDASDTLIIGRHNRHNAELVKRMLDKINIKSDVNIILNKFPGTNRRFEKLTNNIITDYGHHPVEIAATLQMASEISDNITLVYQPHQNIRQHEICDSYTDQFEIAKVIYWLPTYLSREDPSLQILQPSDLIKNITNKNIINIAELDDDLWRNIKQLSDKGSLVICMGAGDIDEWIRNKVSS